MIRVKDIRSMNEKTHIPFSIGDYVTNGTIEGEILNVHPKYATVISEGEAHRIWITDLTLMDKQPKRNQLYKESLIYKGYKTKNLNRTLAEAFKEITIDAEDEFAMLECIKVFDYIVGVTDTTIEEEYGAVRIQIERLRKYSKKVGAGYITEKVASVVEEELCKYAILEGINYTTTDRIMLARVVAMMAGINTINADPTTTINQAAMKLKTAQITTQGWELLGRLFNIVTKAGIRWNKDVFSTSIQKEMRLI